MLAWQKCDTASELEDADACKSALLVVNTDRPKAEVGLREIAPDVSDQRACAETQDRGADLFNDSIGGVEVGLVPTRIALPTGS